MTIQPVKPVYGVLDFQAQLVLPLQANPPVDPIDGSVYADTDDRRIYVWYEGKWRTTTVTATPGAGIMFEFDEDTGLTVISAVPVHEQAALAVTGDWAAGTPAPTRARTGGMVSLGGVATSSKPLSGTPLTTLPAGWRPPSELVFSCAAGSGQANVSVAANGNIVVINGSGQPLRLASICFAAAST